MLTDTQQRFLSLEQGLIFYIGQLDGLIGTTRYSLPAGLPEELVELRDGLKGLVRAEAQRKSSDIPN